MENQPNRAKILFERYSEIQRAYKLYQNLSWIFNQTNDKTSVLIRLAKWDEKVRQAGFKSFNTTREQWQFIIETFLTILTIETLTHKPNLSILK